MKCQLLRWEFALNADPAVQRQLLDLQAVDTALDQLRHRRSHLPVLATLAEQQARFTELAGGLALAQAEVTKAEQAIADVEVEVDKIRAQRERDQRRLDAGSVSSPRELEALQHAIATAAARQSGFEDTELEAMEQLESAQAAHQVLATESDGVVEAMSGSTGERDAAYAEIDAEAGNLTEHRAELAAQIPADLMALYEKLRASSGGVGAAALRAGRCEGCRIELNQAERARVRHLPPEAIARCEDCNRILVRV